MATQFGSDARRFTPALGRALVKLGKKEDAKPVLKAGDAAVSGRSNRGVDLVPELQQLLRTLRLRPAGGLGSRRSQTAD